MPGLDRTIIDQLDTQLALGRIQTDLRTDFIISPHYSAVFANAGQMLWEQLRTRLSSGSFEPSPPVTIDVPKPSRLTRPGSILVPMDRLAYQIIINLIAPTVEGEIDRGRTFSNVLLNPDPEFAMFEASHTSWQRLQRTVRGHCENPQFTHVIKTDVASFFERLYQHNLVNLLRACGCNGAAVNFLEQLLLAWMDRNSHGIIQGIFPSDFLGNVYLHSLDSDLEVRGVTSTRFVDDLYIFHPSKDAAVRGLIHLCRTLRREGLSLNEQKTDIVETSELLMEETELDRLFESAREETERELRGATTSRTNGYGFQDIWTEEDEEEVDEETIELGAVEALYARVTDFREPTTGKIERFCLPILGEAGSDVAIERSLRGLTERPYLSKLYSSYLGALVRGRRELSERIQHLLVADTMPYDWQVMWPIAALIRSEDVQPATINSLMNILRDTSRSEALRGLCPAIIGKYGRPGPRRNLKQHYADEPSPYVRSAILYAARYFPAPERKTCLAAWAGHSVTNTLVAEAVRRLVRE